MKKKTINIVVMAAVLLFLLVGAYAGCRVIGLFENESMTEEEAIEWVREYSKAPYVVIDHYDGDKPVIHCYDVVPVDEEWSHWATYEWLTVDLKSCEAEDFFGKIIKMK